MIDLPEGYRHLTPEETVSSGDLWCHNGEFMPQWIPAKRFGEQLPYNTYCRKVQSLATAASEASNPVDEGIVTPTEHQLTNEVIIPI